MYKTKEIFPSYIKRKQSKHKTPTLADLEVYM